MIPAVKQYLLEHWVDFDLGDKPDDLLFIKFMDRGIRSAEVGCLTFLVKQVRRSLERPVLIVKIPRYPKNPEANRSLELEFNNLSLVRSRSEKDNIINSIPRPIFLKTIDSCQVLAISFLAGGDLGRWFVTPDPFESAEIKYKMAFDWLISFQKLMGEKPAELDEGFIDKYVNGPIEKYRQTFSADTERYKQYFTKIASNAREKIGKKIKLYPQHGDWHASNILAANGKISGVIDWEDFSLDAPPCYDLFYFIRTYTDALYNSLIYRDDPVLIDNLANSTRYFEVVERIIEYYCKNIEIDIELVNVFLPLYIIGSLNAAGDPRKVALPACERGELLLSMEIENIRNLVTALSVFAYLDLGKRAYAANNLELVGICKERMNAIFKRFIRK